VYLVFKLPQYVDSISGGLEDCVGTAEDATEAVGKFMDDDDLEFDIIFHLLPVDKNRDILVLYRLYNHGIHYDGDRVLSDWKQKSIIYDAFTDDPSILYRTQLD
jgi:hypothetical protein